MSAPERRAKVERPGVDVSVRRQCALLNLARSGVYRPKPAPDADDLALMGSGHESELYAPFARTNEELKRPELTSHFAGA